VSVAVSGAAYVDAMNRDPADRECRRAFVRLALSLAKPGGRVFDFGCGPGLDAKAYAAAGLRVAAFDIDAGMRDYLSEHCESEIAAGTVRLMTGTYAEFLRTARAHGNDDLIVSNFAPLNLVGDLQPLFAKFAAFLTPHGKLLASVLNPWFGRLWHSPKWWMRLPRLLSTGAYTTYLHGSIPVTRWLPGRIARQANPHFELTSVYTPDPVGGAPPCRVRLASPRDWPRLVATQFLFLEFDRRRHT
jgi:SAM-dependent methyltransferase